MKKYFLYILFFVFNVNCSDNNKENSEDYPIEGALSKQINVQNFFNTLPSSGEIFEIIKQTNLNYNFAYLNDPTKYKMYSLEKPMAMNLGVYGADMAIAGVFNQTHEVMLFLKCVNSLSQRLGISSAFDEQIINRLEIHRENRDSTLEIILQTFKRVDKLFIDNKRGGLSILMIVGAYIESMYVAGEYALSKSEDTMSMNKIKQMYNKQSESLFYLINLLRDSEDIEDKEIKETLEGIYKSIKESEENADHFVKTHEMISEFRKKIINVY